MRALTKMLSLACLCCCAMAALAQTTVETFAPTGTVKKVRQATARFSGQMVAFGDLRLDDPFAIDCPEKGRGRWIDGKNWSYDFERDLPAGITCRFTLKPGQTDLAGQPLAGDRQFGFATGGPAIVEALPRDGAMIDENQIFVLGLDAVARDDTIAANAYCRADGINEQIGVRVITGPEREQVLALQKRFVDRYRTLYFGVGAGQRAEAPLAVLQCKRHLPANASVSLVWGPGISTASGIATTEKQALAYKTRAEFSAELHCERVSAKAQCIPFLPMRLEFSAPIRAQDAKAINLTRADGTIYQPSFDDREKNTGYVDGVTLKGPFPEKAKLVLRLPADLKDDAGRRLLNQSHFPLTVRTGEQPPLVRFPAAFGILEARGDRLLPVTVRNVEAGLAARMRKVDGGSAIKGSMLRVGDGQQDRHIIEWLQRMSGHDGWVIGEQLGDEIAKSVFNGVKATTSERFVLPKPNGKRAFEVIGIPLRQPGFYVVELASPKLGAALNEHGGTAYIRTAALVTNLAAHFKHGAQSSLVWVTSLDRGKPVPNAQVAVRDCAGKLLWQGATDSIGVAQIPHALPESKCRQNNSYFVSARSGGDMTFTLSDWQNGIESWRFNVSQTDRDSDNRIAATVFDRTLLRAGETVHMKHFLRKHMVGGIAHVGANDKVSAAPGNWRARELGVEDRAARPAKVYLVHQGSDQKYELPASWNAAGNAENSWPIPVDAKLGMYEVMLGGQLAGKFRVEQFRVPAMKAIVQGPKSAAVQPAQLDLDVQVNYLAGGGASLMPVKLRTLVQDRSVTFADYDEFAFGTGDVAEGAVSDSAAFDEDEGAADDAAGGQGGAGAVQTRALTLDRNGGARIVLDQLPKVQRPRDLLAELSYQDANGETLSSWTRIALWPSSYVIGIKPDGWLLSKDAFKFQVAVLDVAGKPVADAPAAVDFLQRVTYSHRRRLIGGFYSYENTREVKRLGQACEGRTDRHGLMVCEVKAPADGNLILRARTTDPEQRAAVTHRDVWVGGDEESWFDTGDNDRIDLLPSTKRYEPGETASFQVRSPFREATALITVEREGIVDTYVRQLSGTAPVFTIPVKPNYAPNVFVSALVVRGRIASAPPTALVDLGKPAYKLGIAPIRVGWAAHELKVQVTTDKAVYKVRDKASVVVKVTLADGTAPPAGSEVALAAVDVGLLELMPNASWDLLEAMMRERSLQVETSTAQMQVIGKRHFGRKAFPHGGGGGKSGSRELFDTLLFWKARVALDANGEASVQVPLNDSLTAFRIVAIASGRADLFGTGKTEIRSSQDLILLSGLPSLVREGDRFRAGFTLRNTTAGELKVELGASVAADGGKGQPLAPQSLTLAAGQAQDVGWDYQVPTSARGLVWDVEARATDAAGAVAGDKLRARQKVTFAVPLRTVQATLMQLDQPQTIKVQMPVDALPGRGGVRTSFSARLGNDLPGVREYMSAYPYTCFEQNASRAIALRDPALWKTAVAILPAHLDADGLLKYFAAQEEGSDSLTAYVLSVAQEAGYEIPADLKGRMEEGLVAFVQGRVARRSALATADLAVRKMAALEALSRAGRVKPAMLESFSIEPNLWPTSAVIDWYLVLHRTPDLPAHDAQLAQVQQILRARLNMQGATMGFSTERSDDLWWLMAGPDVNANRLLLAMLDNPAWQADMGRLARGTLGRQQKGRWRTTLANAWGVLAIEKFSNKFEQQAVTGSSSAALGSDSRELKWTAPGASGNIMHPWPKGPRDLTLRHTGAGKPWATVQSVAAIPLAAPLSSGYRISKSITPVAQKVKGAWSRGDVYRVRLDLEAQSDMTWVVVDDPIPASASVLGTGLGRDSQITSGGEKQRGWVRPVYEERSFDGFRAYYEYVPKGKWSIEYTVRLNNQGRFNLPPTRVEAMYSPEMFGESPNAAIGVAR
jgi:uncharacterized protein YfaS (alpha-2-macroglobulin family)